MKTFISILALGLTLSASAGASVCLTKSQLNDHTVQDDTHLVFATPFKGNYMFTLKQGCGFENVDYIGLETFSDFQVCSGDRILTYQRNVGETGSCEILSIDKN